MCRLHYWQEAYSTKNLSFLSSFRRGYLMVRYSAGHCFVDHLNWNHLCYPLDRYRQDLWDPPMSTDHRDHLFPDLAEYLDLWGQTLPDSE